VSQGISDSYLRWRGIEATLQLAQSNNSKIVIVGGGKDGLPIILGNVDAAATPPAVKPPPLGEPEKTDAQERLNPPSQPLEKSAAPGLPSPEDNQAIEAAPPPPALSDRLRSMLSPNLSDVRSMILGTPKPAPDASGQQPAPPP
jgi:hypothetical protein